MNCLSSLKSLKPEMKSTIAGLLLLFSLFEYLEVTTALTDAELDALGNKAREECYVEHHLTPAEIELVKVGGMVSKANAQASENLKCYVFCFYKKIGLMDDAGKMKPDMIMKYVEHISADKTKARTKLLNCATVKGDNQCDTVFKLETCIANQA